MNKERSAHLPQPAHTGIRKPAFWAAAAALLFCGAAAVFLLTRPARTPAAQDPSASLPPWETDDAADPADLDALRNKHPDYFGLPTKKGLQVFVWQMARDHYACALFADGETPADETLWTAKGTTIPEMRMILDAYALPPEKIRIVPFVQPYSSYAYVIDDAYVTALRQLFFPEADDAGTVRCTMADVACVGWSDPGALIAGARNVGEMYKSAERHLPAYKLDSVSDLEIFKKNFGGILQLDYSREDEKLRSFNDLTAGLDDGFFADSVLLLAYVEASSGSYRFGLQEIARGGGTCRMLVRRLNDPEVVTCDMAGWLILAAVPRAELTGCVAFDALMTENG